ncbi:MAG: Txe/YoeB family addiction module toxin [Terrimicrobiaceae bacterium]
MKSGYSLIVDRAFPEDLQFWVETQPRVASKVLELVESISRDPYAGLGKPERVRAIDAWSRRITQEHRLVYRVDERRVYLLQCRYHY